jgi:hypothetical protein
MITQIILLLLIPAILYLSYMLDKYIKERNLNKESKINLQIIGKAHEELCKSNEALTLVANKTDVLFELANPEDLIVINEQLNEYKTKIIAFEKIHANNMNSAFNPLGLMYGEPPKKENNNNNNKGNNNNNNNNNNNKGNNNNNNSN